MSMHKWYTYPGYLATIIFIAVLTKKFATNILSNYKMGLDDEEQTNTHLYIDEDDDQWSDDSTDSEMVDQSDEDLVSLYIQVPKPISRQNKTRRELKRLAVRRLVEGRHVKLSQSPVAIKNNTDKLSSPFVLMILVILLQLGYIFVRRNHQKEPETYS
ncbi:uncharacterized protein LOC126909520 [Daktulosphaira vitifoliae]|uniref:uncharacterized protein LOC126909520 n=1 Tax=Daktulosphaira vitifoliae TaxID=58002 RepID=UPI0021AA2AE2|nr:uncharacterized protein LOC126909520 [Daktulosphaira vitifoliae]